MDPILQGGLILLIPALLALLGAVLMGRWSKSNQALASDILETDRMFEARGFPRLLAAKAVEQHSRQTVESYGEARFKLLLVGFVTLAVALSLIAYSFIPPAA